MKNAIASVSSRIFLMSLFLMAGVNAFAQEAGTTSQSNTTESHSSSTVPVPNDAQSWMSNPIVWVVGGVVLLLIIVLLVSNSRGNTSKSTVSRTTTTEVKVD